MKLTSSEAWRWNLQRLVHLHFLAVAAWGSLGVAAASAKDITIGVILPLHGPWEAIGWDQRRGIELAFDAGRSRIETSNFRLRLTIFDDSCKPEVTIAQAGKLISQEQVIVLLGAPCTAHSTDVAAFANISSVPFLTTGPLPSQVAHSPPQERMLFQLGVLRETIRQFTQDLSSKTNLKIPISSPCLWTYERFVPQNYDATVCPSVGIERHRWESLRQKHRNKFSSEPGPGAAIGFAAMEIILASMKGQPSSKSAIATALRTQEVDTILGKIRVGGDGLRPTLQVITASSSSETHRKTLSANTTNGDCDTCRKNGECPQGSYKDLRYSAKGEDCCKKSPSGECPQGSLLNIY